MSDNGIRVDKQHLLLRNSGAGRDFYLCGRGAILRAFTARK